MKIVFMGTPKIARDVLSKMIDGGYAPGLVVTQPDKEKNRGKKVIPPEVKVLASEKGITVLQPEKVRNNEEFINELSEYSPDVCVVIAYGKILPKSILDIPKYGCINIHASLLPKHRGASPIQSAILLGDEVTGVTIMQMDEGMDTGDMLLKGEVEISGMNSEELADRLGELGGELVLEALAKLESGELTPEKQNNDLATYTGLIKKDDGKIDFESFSAKEIERMTRAYYPWPGVNIKYGEEWMKLCKVMVTDEESHEGCTPGEIIKADNSGIYVATKDGVLRIDELQLPGKNKVLADAFLRGHKLEKNAFVNNK